MALGQMAPLMFPGPGCARTSAFTSLHHPPQGHRQPAVLVCHAWIPVHTNHAGRLGTQWHSAQWG